MTHNRLDTQVFDTFNVLRMSAIGGMSMINRLVVMGVEGHREFVSNINH